MTDKVSIITTTYNDCEHLRIVVNGIKNQDYDNIEYIIVDGDSKDGTKDFLKELEESFKDRTGRSFQYISEPDQGIYDAINKGISMATGDIIGFMFDEFHSDNAISLMVQAISVQNTDGVHSDLDYINAEGKVVRRWRMKEGTIRGGWMPGHPTLYLKREVYEQYGTYKTDYKIAADYEFIVRILKDSKVKLAYIPEVLVHMFYGGTSTNGMISYVDSFKESYRALKENNVKFALSVCMIRTIRVLWQFIK